MHKYVRQKDNPGSIINNDVEALKAYKARKEAAKESKVKMEKMEKEIIDLKTLLHDLIQRIDKQ